MNSLRSAARRRLFSDSIALALLALTAVGCNAQWGLSGKPTSKDDPLEGNISGTVTYNAKPLVYGTVTFLGSGKPIQSMIQRDGGYSVRGVAVGHVQVTVASPDPKSIGSMANWKDPTKKPEPLDIPGWFAIPTEYESTGTSKLTYTIHRGENTINIELN
jgi:hypothetical protein